MDINAAQRQTRDITMRNFSIAQACNVAFRSTAIAGFMAFGFVLSRFLTAGV